MEKYGIKAEELNDFMNKKCGMKGISGVSSDFRDLQLAKNNNDRARLALDMFAYQVKKYIGGYIAALNGIDALVFTAGVGENDVNIRAAITRGLENIGISIDLEKNYEIKGVEGDISGKDSKVRVLVVPTNEELMIARETMEMIR